MSTCPKGDRLHAWLDGRLAASEAEAIRVHSAACPACRSAADEYRGWARRLGSLPRPRPSSPCPPPDVLAQLAAGAAIEPERRDAALTHLASCVDCRNDVFEARALLVSKPSSEILRVSRRPRRTTSSRWIAAAAAAAALALGLAWALSGKDPAPPGVVKQPVKPKPTIPVPAPPAPEPPPPAPAPAPAPQPAPPPVVPPEPPPQPEAPKPQPPKPPAEVAKPATEPEKPPTPRPPEKPAPVVTRPARRGSLIAVAGGCSTQAEGEAAWQPARTAQPKEFAGTLRVKTDAGASKLRLGDHTLWLQRGTEMAVVLEEARTLIRLAKGDACFDVAAGKGPFEVDAPWGSVAVKATRFLVSAEKAETEVLVQRGKVEFVAGGQAVTVSAGERSVASAGRAPGAPARSDVARRLQWIRSVEESLWIEAEQLAVQQGMTVIADAAASGGKALAAKAPVPAGQEPAGEIRVKRKQAAPYAVWVRLHWSHGVASSGWVQVHDAPRWTANHVAANPAWQWAKVGVYELPDEPFRLRVADPQGGLRLDQFLMTSDLEFNPETDRR